MQQRTCTTPCSTSMQLHTRPTRPKQTNGGNTQCASRDNRCREITHPHERTWSAPHDECRPGTPTLTYFFGGDTTLAAALSAVENSSMLRTPSPLRSYDSKELIMALAVSLSIEVPSSVGRIRILISSSSETTPSPFRSNALNAFRSACLADSACVARIEFTSEKSAANHWVGNM